MESRDNRNKNNISNWLGILFFVIFLGAQFIQPLFNMLAQFIGQATAQRLGASLAPLLPIVVIGLVVISILVSVMSAIGRGVTRMRDSVELPGPDLPRQMEIPPLTAPGLPPLTRTTRRTYRVRDSETSFKASSFDPTPHDMLGSNMRAKDLERLIQNARTDDQTALPNSLRNVGAPSRMIRNGTDPDTRL
ncbi:MAG: hypothetical protein HC893_01375 [Chloroflexaceae bacterium]|nr:hypothetical protein [Chloroflexaceae bacterium]